MTNADERIVAIKAKKKGLRVWAVREEPPLWVLEVPEGHQRRFQAWGSVDAWDKGVDGYGSKLRVIPPSCLIADNQRAEKAILDGNAEAL